MPAPRQGLSVLSAVTLLIGTLVVIQLWLAAAALDAFLGGDASVLVPAAAACGALALGNGGLLLYALGLDRRIRARGRRGGD
ncbi:MAG TPA: DUF6755 family protein [Planctomycetota bacterium]|nr:DUF6755 family protein [Planctomycetota bacterium]